MKSRILTLLVAAVLMTSPALFAQINNVVIDGAFGDWADENTNIDIETSVATCDDIPGQNDVKAAGIASDFDINQPATEIFLRFDFDNTTVTGGNSVDGCWLLDITGASMVTQALCFSLVGAGGGGAQPIVLGQVDYYTCNGSTVDTCAGNAQQTTPASATCQVAQITAPDILHDCTGGAPVDSPDPGDTSDTAVECKISLADIGWVSGPVSLMQACSYSSGQPNSNGFDCVIDATRPWSIDPETGTNDTPAVPVELFSFSVD